MPQATSTTHFEKVAAGTVAALPAAFREPASKVVLQVADWPSEEMLNGLGIEYRDELTGLYEGIPLTEKSVWDVAMQPDTVWLFRKPILLEWEDRRDVDLDDLIAHVVIHEFAHHFGWSDEDIARIDRWWE